MGAALMKLVDRKMEILAAEERAEHMPQSSEDFFTREDRKELFRQTVLAEQTQRDIAEIKSTAKETARTHMEYVEAHEKRIRDLEDSRPRKDHLDAHDKRLRVLEDSRLQLQTQIRTSWWWIVLFSAGASAGVNFLMRLLLK